MKAPQILLPVAIVLVAVVSILLKQSPFFVVVAALLWAGAVLEPCRVYQSLAGRLLVRADKADPAVRKAARAFLWAFPCWLGLLWAVWNTMVRNQCSGDSCIGDMLWGIPFPFLYGRAEFLLHLAKGLRSREAD